MKKKIVGILMFMLLIFATVLPVAGTMNVGKTSNEENNILGLDEVTPNEGLPPESSQLKGDRQDSDWDYWSNPPHMIAMNSGSVCIGTTNPLAKLTVNGYIMADDIYNPGQRYIQLESAGAQTIRATNDLYIDYAGVCHFGVHSGNGKVAIAKTWPQYQLDVGGDIGCTDLYASGNVGIGTTSPTEKLDVAGTAQMTWFKMPTGASDGYVLTSDGSGMGTWQEAPSDGIGGSGTSNYIPKFTDSTTLGDSVIYETGGNVGIGTTNPIAKLTVKGSALYGTIRLIETDDPHDEVHKSLLFIGNEAQDNYTEARMSFGAYGNATPGQGAHNRAMLAALYDPLGGNYGGQFRFKVRHGTTSYHDAITIRATGNVGIDTADPSEKLEVNGNVKATSFFGDGSSLTGVVITESDPIFTASAASGISTGDITNWNTAYGWGDHASAGYDTSDDTWAGTGNVYTTSGNVGIGTNTPEYLLDISGGSDIVAQFSGRVKGADAVNDDEFVTKGQVESSSSTFYTPTETIDPNGNIGDTAWDSNYFYVKTSQGWKRLALETWSVSME